MSDAYRDNPLAAAEQRVIELREMVDRTDAINAQLQQELYAAKTRVRRADIADMVKSVLAVVSVCVATYAMVDETRAKNRAIAEEMMSSAALTACQVQLNGERSLSASKRAGPTSTWIGSDNVRWEKVGCLGADERLEVVLSCWPRGGAGPTAAISRINADGTMHGFPEVLETRYFGGVDPVIFNAGSYAKTLTGDVAPGTWTPGHLDIRDPAPDRQHSASWMPTGKLP